MLLDNDAYMFAPDRGLPSLYSNGSSPCPCACLSQAKALSGAHQIPPRDGRVSCQALMDPVACPVLCYLKHLGSLDPVRCHFGGGFFGELVRRNQWACPTQKIAICRTKTFCMWWHLVQIIFCQTSLTVFPRNISRFLGEWDELHWQHVYI